MIDGLDEVDPVVIWRSVGLHSRDAYGWSYAWDESLWQIDTGEKERGTLMIMSTEVVQRRRQRQ